MPDVVLRPAEASDAHDIARILRAAFSAFDWMPQLHTPDEDLYFVRHVLLAQQCVVVATAMNSIVGFISVEDDWVEQLYLDPDWTGRDIGSRLLRHATSGMPAPSSIASRPTQAHAASTNATASRLRPWATAPATKKGCLIFSTCASSRIGSWLKG